MLIRGHDYDWWIVLDTFNLRPLFISVHKKSSGESSTGYMVTEGLFIVAAFFFQDSVPAYQSLGICHRHITRFHETESFWWAVGVGFSWSRWWDSGWNTVYLLRINPYEKKSREQDWIEEEVRLKCKPKKPWPFRWGVLEWIIIKRLSCIWLKLFYLYLNTYTSFSHQLQTWLENHDFEQSSSQ